MSEANGKVIFKEISLHIYKQLFIIIFSKIPEFEIHKINKSDYCLSPLKFGIIKTYMQRKKPRSSRSISWTSTTLPEAIIFCTVFYLSLKGGV